MIPGGPVLTVKTAHTAFGAKPYSTPAIDIDTVHPFVNQLLDVGFKFIRFTVQIIGTCPGTDPQAAIMIIGKRVNPVISETVHGEIGFPVAILVTRHTPCICTKPLVPIAVYADTKHIFIGEAMITIKGIIQLTVFETYLQYT